LVPFGKNFHIPLQVPFTAIRSSTGHSAGTLLLEKELPMTRHYLASLLLATPGLALAAPAPAPAPAPISLTDCAAIAENGKRLACFDRLASTAGVTPVDPAAAPTAALAQAESATPPSPVISANHQDRAAPDSTLKGYWELGQENKHGRFVFQPYQPN
jgi:phospholipase A1